MHQRVLSGLDRVHGTRPADRLALLWARHKQRRSIRGCGMHVVADQLDRVVLSGHVPKPMRLHARTRLDVQRQPSDLVDPRYVPARRFVLLLDRLYIESSHRKVPLRESTLH
jgi:hypothetical protein